MKTGTTLKIVDNKILSSPQKIFYSQNILFYGSPLSLNKEVINFHITNPTCLIQADAKQIFYYIKPNENIIVSLDNNSFYNFYIPDNKTRTNELNFFKELILKFGKLHKIIGVGLTTKDEYPTVSKIDSFETIKEANLNLRKLRLDFLNQYRIKFPISDSFFTLAQSIINDVGIIDMLFLVKKNTGLLTNINQFQVYKNKILDEFNNSSFNNSFIHSQLCTEMLNFLYSQITGKIKSTDANDLNKFNFITDNFKDQTKDFLLANYLYGLFKKESKDFKVLYELYKKDSIKNEMYLIELNSNINNIVVPSNISKSTNDVLITLNDGFTDLKTIIIKHKGFLILLDFWASWCTPCREEMRYSNDIRNRYKNQKIKFIYLSIDKNIVDWKNACKDEALENSESYIFTNEEKSKWINTYSIFTIPRYMLISKEGKIISTDAPRLSDPKLKILLDKHLKN